MRVFSARFIRFFVILLLLGSLLIALLPTLASTNWGRKQVVAWINQAIPGNIEVHSLALQWGKGQTLQGLLLKDPKGQTVLSVEKFSTDATLWQLFRKKTHLGFTQLQDLNAAIITNENGETNLQQALGIPFHSDSLVVSPSSIILSQVNADLYLFANNHPLSVWMKGLTRQENLNGSFEIDLSLAGLQASDWEELKKDAENYLSMERSKEAKLQAQIINFPVDLIDRLVALKNPLFNGLFRSLLGDRLNLTIDKEPDQEGLAFHLIATSPLMQGSVKGKVIDNLLTLQQPASFDFNLTPEFVNPFTNAHFELLSASKLTVALSTLSFPLNFLDNETTIDPCLFGFKATLTLPKTEIHVHSIGRVSLEELQAHLDAPVCETTIQLQVRGQAQQGKEPFTISLNSTLSKPKNLASLAQSIRQGLQASTKISHLPLQLIPTLQEHPEWIEQIGTYADVQVNLTSVNQEEWLAILSLQTSHLNLKEAQFHIGKDIVLHSPAQVHWTGTADCLLSMLKTEEWVLDHPCSLSLTLKQFQLPLAQPELAKYQLESTIPQLQFSKLLSWSKVRVQDMTLQIDGQDLNHFHSQLKGQLSLLTHENLNSPLVPLPLQFNQNSDWDIESTETIKMPRGHLQLNNPNTHIQAEFGMTSNQELELTKPAQIQYTLTPQALQTLSQLFAKEWPILQKATSLQLTIDPTSFHLQTFSLASLRMQGMLTIDDIILQDTSGALPRLKDIVLPWVIDVPKNKFYANLKGLAYSQKNVKPTQLSAFFQFWPKEGYFDPAHAQTEMRMNLVGMPTSFLNVLLKMDDLSPVLGPIMDLNLKAFFDPTQEKPGYWDLALHSSQLQADGRFTLDRAATLSDPHKLPHVQLTITPESYLYLKKIFAMQDDRKLAAPFTISGVLSQFSFPLKNSFIDPGQFDFKLSTTPIQWQDAAIPSFQLESQINSQNLRENLHFSAKILSSSPSLNLQGTLTDLFDQENQLRNWQQMGLKAHIEGKQLTADLLQSLLFLDFDLTQKLKALFGESFEVHANCQLKDLNGPLQASAIGPQGEIHLDGQIKKGVLTLHQPLEGSVKMTPLLSQAFLAKNVPILSSAIGAENPIKFRIDPTQFFCPLIPFQLDQIKIAKGTLELGKVHFRNEGELSSLLSLIHSLSDPYLTIWFTPLYFELNHGILNLKRLDMLIAHTYSLASWGTVDLINHQADLILGINGQTLQYAFGIQGLDEDYILQIPLHSANGKVEIDKKRATGRISALLAQTQGGSTGKLLGNLMDLALSKNSAASPPPTTQPFPWAGEFNSTPSTSHTQTSPTESAPDDTFSETSKEHQEKKKKKRKHHKNQESNETLKDLQQGTGQLLDQLFGQ